MGWGSGWEEVGGWGWGWVVGQGRERGGAGAGGKVQLVWEVGVGGWGWCRYRHCCRRCCYRGYLGHLGCQGDLHRGYTKCRQTHNTVRQCLGRCSGDCQCGIMHVHTQTSILPADRVHATAEA